MMTRGLLIGFVALCPGAFPRRVVMSYAGFSGKVFFFFFFLVEKLDTWLGGAHRNEF